MKFEDFPGNRIGEPVRADWGRRIERAIIEARPRPRPGQTMNRNAYGVMLGPEPSEGKTIDLVESYPFKVRWQKTGASTGEWQIYLPRGSVTLTSEGLRQSYIPLNAVGKDAEGNDAFRWYKIADPDASAASVGRMGRYVAKTWPVTLLMKPWPRLKAVAAEKDDDFGRATWTRTVATIGIVEIGTGASMVTHHFVQRMIDDLSIENTWDARGAFALRFDVASESPSAAITAKIINIDKMVGRLNLVETNPHDVTDAETVWVKIAHEDEAYELTIETDLDATEAQSDDDQTVVKIWTLDDNVPMTDSRTNITGLNLDFYTNPPAVTSGS